MRLFRVLCLVATIGFISFWCYEFYLDEDLTVVEYKRFDNSKSTMLPTASVCFDNPIVDKKLKQIHPDLNSSIYLKFLRGLVYSESLRNIDYENVTLQWSDYLDTNSMVLTWKNGSWIYYNTTFSTFLKKPYMSYSGFLYFKFAKCFAFELQDKYKNLVSSIWFPFNTEIFSDDGRNDFRFIFHYPGQFSIAPDMTKLQWTDFKMRKKCGIVFRTTVIEVMQRRNKYRQACLINGQEYDDIIHDAYIKTVGCKPPYHQSAKDWPICSSTDDMRKFVSLNVGKLDAAKYFTPPCTVMSSVHYKVDEYSLLLAEKHCEGLLVMIPHFSNQYRSVKLTKAISITSFIGNAGGYIGLFLGKGTLLALMHSHIQNM